MVEKIEGASTIYSMYDFDKKQVKPNTPLGEWYINGRFGAVPTVNFSQIKNFILDHKTSATEE